MVNGIAPHPVETILATCGIDHEGKIFEVGPTPTFDEKKANKIVESNMQNTETAEEVKKKSINFQRLISFFFSRSIC